MHSPFLLSLRDSSDLLFFSNTYSSISWHIYDIKLDFKSMSTHSCGAAHLKQLTVLLFDCYKQFTFYEAGIILPHIGWPTLVPSGLVGHPSNITCWHGHRHGHKHGHGHGHGKLKSRLLLIGSGSNLLTCSSSDLGWLCGSTVDYHWSCIDSIFHQISNSFQLYFLYILHNFIIIGIYSRVLFCLCVKFAPPCTM